MKLITAFFMAWGNFLTIPCPLKKWDNDLKNNMLAFLPSIGAVVGGLWVLLIWIIRLIGNHTELPVQIPVSLGAIIAVYFLFACCGFMHLDVKPENFLLKESPNGLPIVKLTDFDLAKKSDDNGPYPQPGTPAYMAPEQFKEKMAFMASDVFAFSLMMYRIVTGKAAFVADTKKKLLHLQASSVQTARHPQDIDPSLNPALCAIIMKGLAKKRDQRYPDMMAMADDLKKKVESIHI